MPDPWQLCRSGQLVWNLMLTREEMLGADYCRPGELCEKPSLVLVSVIFWLFVFLIKHYWVSFPSKTTTNGVLCPVYSAETPHQMGHPSPELGESLFQMAKWNIAKYACKVFEHSVTDSQNKQRWGKSRINNSWGKAAFLWMLQPVSKETHGDDAWSREQDKEVVRQLWRWALQHSSNWNSPTIRLFLKNMEIWL